MRSLLLAAPVVLLVGCVAGNNLKLDYRPATAANIGNNAAVVVAAEDARQYVVNGEEPKSFIGELRNGYGMPFNVTTEGQVAFATIVAESARRDLAASGFRAVAAGSAEDMASGMGANKATRGLLIKINEFKADTMNRSTVHYDLVASVVDGSGRVLATNQKNGEEVVQGSFMNPAKAMKANVPIFFYKQVHELVSDSKIVNALQSK